MDDTRRCSSKPLVGFLLCAAIGLVTAGCGSDGTSTSAPGTQNDTAPAATSSLSISGTADTTVVAETRYSFQPSVADTSGDALTFSIQNLPAWATFDASSGILSGTPSAANVGTYQSITITVSDGSISAQLAPFTIVVSAPATPTAPTDTAPTITGKPSTAVQAGSHYAFQPSASDADKDALVFSITGLPSWASFNTSTGLLSGTPASANVGTFSNIVVSVSDGKTSVSLAAFAVTVTAIASPPTNTPPKISGTPGAAVQAGTAYSFQPAAADADGNTLTFAIANKPSWANFSAANGQLSGTPKTTDVGAYANITISVSDGTTSVSLPAFTIQVTAPAAIPPTIGGTPPKQAQVGAAYSFTPTASDPNGKTLSFSVQNKPSWASFSIATGQLSGTPTSADVGTDSNIIISTSDGTTSAALAAFTIQVAAAPPASGTATLKWTAPTTSTDGTPITNLSGYTIAYGTSASSLAQTVTITNPAVTTYTVQNLGQGTWYFAVSATESDGTVSSLSSVVSKTIQ